MRFLLFLFLVGIASAAAPTRIPSFGPNGTHWPDMIPTPFIHDVQPLEIEVACTWEAIKAAIVSIDAGEAAAGVRIRVQPGIISGSDPSGYIPGSGSSSRASIRDCGSKAWTKRVLVCPRDGYGSVTIQVGKAQRVYGVCFAGFIVEESWAFHGCANSVMAWWKIKTAFNFYGERTVGLITENCEVVEIVRPDSKVYNADSCDIFSSGGVITNSRFDGCYFAPSFYIDQYYAPGKSPHTDTLQFAQPLGGNSTYVTLRDVATFGSNNCSIQTGNSYDITYNHCYIVSGATSKSRYPVLPGGSSNGVGNAFNGSGREFNAVDSIFIGGMAINDADVNDVGSPYKVWNSVTNTQTSAAYPAFLQPRTGSWTVNAGLNAANSGMPPYPTDEYLSTIWANPADLTAVQPIAASSLTGTYDAALSVTLSTTTSGATIYYTTNGTDPTTGSSVYSTPLAISADTTLKAFGVKSGITDSPILTTAYAFKAQTPVISPFDTLSISSVTVTIVSPTAGAATYYTTNGTDPTAASTLYSGPFDLTSSAVVKAITIKGGLADSNIAESTMTVGVFNSAPAVFSNIALGDQTGTWTAQFDISPSANNIDAATAVGYLEASSFADMAAIVRFSPAGVIDARNGAVYAADSPVSYSGGGLYHVRMVLDSAARRYDVFITPNGGATTQIANDYLYRGEQSAISFFRFLSFASTSGTHQISNIVISSASGEVPIPVSEIFTALPLASPITNRAAVTSSVTFASTATQGSGGLSLNEPTILGEVACAWGISGAGNWRAMNGASWGATNTVAITAEEWQVRYTIRPTTYDLEVRKASTAPAGAWSMIGSNFTRQMTGGLAYVTAQSDAQAFKIKPATSVVLRVLK